MRLNVLMIPTWSSGITFYRMFNFWKAAYRTGLANFRVLWWQKNCNEPHPWQREIFDPSHMWRITKEMQDWIMQSDVIVMGTLSGTGRRVIANKEPSQDYVNDTLGIFEAIKDIIREHGPNKVLMTECDDNVISTPEYNPAYNFFVQDSEIREITLKQFEKSDGVIVSTPYLKDLYTEFNPSCHLVPNCIDFNLWDHLVSKKKRGVRIGWGGGANHEEDLRVLVDVIPKVIEANKEARFVFIHGCPHYLRKIQGVEYVKNWVPINKWPNYLAHHDFDIGIAPLIDNAFNRSKSNLKWLEYSALGLPTVASNVGHYKETIQNGTDGLLVDTPEEWIKALNFLVNNKSERRIMGSAANARVRRDFNADVVVRSYIQILETERFKKQALDPSHIGGTA